jgi:hypothetical protein
MYTMSSSGDETITSKDEEKMISQFIQDQTTVLTPREAAEALYSAWMTMFGTKPSITTLATLWAQTAFETGRWTSMHCYNWGNVRKISNPDDEHNWCQYSCSEYKGNVLEKYYPPDPRCSFRAYSSAASGALDYLLVLSRKVRYKDAWQVVIDGGDVSEFVHKLKVGDGSPNSGGYFTDKEEHYLTGVKHYYDEFLVKHYMVIPNSIPPEEKIEEAIPSAPLEIAPHKLWTPEGKGFVANAITSLKNFMKKLH